MALEKKNDKDGTGKFEKVKVFKKNLKEKKTLKNNKLFQNY